MSCFVVIQIFLCKYITLGSKNWTIIDKSYISNITLKLSSSDSQQSLRSFSKIIGDMHNTNISNCIPINHVQSTMILQINFISKVLIEINEIQIGIFSPNISTINIGDTVYIQTFDIRSNNIMIITGSVVVDINKTVSNVDTHYIHQWQTDAHKMETDIPLTQSAELYLIQSSNTKSICSITIYGNVIQSTSLIEDKESSICLTADNKQNDISISNDYQGFGTFHVINTTTLQFETLFFKQMMLDTTYNIYQHDSLYLFLFKLNNFGWILVGNNLPFINQNTKTKIYLTCFCDSCQLQQCGFNKWYSGFNQTDHLNLISTIRISAGSCWS